MLLATLGGLGLLPKASAANPKIEDNTHFTELVRQMANQEISVAQDVGSDAIVLADADLWQRYASDFIPLKRGKLPISSRKIFNFPQFVNTIIFRQITDDIIRNRRVIGNR